MRLSLIVAVYNGVEVLPRLLDSIFNVPVEDAEVIFVDYGSTDGSKNLIESYRSGGGNIRYIALPESEEDPADRKLEALNTAIDAATGDYIHTLDQSDEIMPYAYEAALAKAYKYDLDLMRVAAIAIDDEQGDAMEVPDFSMVDFPLGMFHRLWDFSPESYRFNRIPDPRLCIFKRSFLNENRIRFEKIRGAGERLFLAQSVFKAPRMSAVKDRIFVDRMQPHLELADGHGELMDEFQVLDRVIFLAEEVDIPTESSIQFAINDFVGICNYLKRALCELNPESAQLYLMLVESYVNEKAQDPLLGVSFKKAFRELRSTVMGAKKAAVPKKKKVFYEVQENPKVSVVVPIYNQEDYLNIALDTLTSQKLRKMEFILVNDGSTDSSLTIMKEYAWFDKRFKIIDKPNSGYGHSMNVGFDAATGEYVGILEPDDYVVPEMFRDLYALAKEEDADLVKADFNWFVENEDGTYKTRLRRLSDNKEDYGRLINPRNEPRVFGFWMNTWAGIYKKSFLQKNGIRHHESPGASYQDCGFYFQTFIMAEKVAFMNKPFYQYRKDNPNASVADRSDAKLYAITKEFEFIHDYMEKHPETLVFEPQFQSRKFTNFLLSYRRATVAKRPEYAEHMRDEFKEPLAQGLITPETFNEFSYKTVCEVTEDPKAFVERTRITLIAPFANDTDRIDGFMNVLIGRDEIRTQILLVDMGSTDGTRDKILAYAKKYPAIQILEGTYEKTADAYNAAMDQAIGDTVAFLSPDYDYDTDYVRRVATQLYGYDAELTVCNAGLSNSASIPSEGVAYGKKAGLIPSQKTFSFGMMYEDRFRALGSCLYTMAFTRSFLEKHRLRFQPQKDYTEACFSVQALIEAERICRRGMELVHYPEGFAKYEAPGSFVMEICDAVKEKDPEASYEYDLKNYALYICYRSLLYAGNDFCERYRELAEQIIKPLAMTELSETQVADEELLSFLTVLKTQNEEEMFAFFIDRLQQSIELCDDLKNKEKSLKKQMNYYEKRYRTSGRELMRMKNTLEKLTEKAHRLEVKISEKEARISRIENSIFWKVALPLRKLSGKRKG